MANVTKPIALNETFKTTGNSPKNIADVLEDNGADLITQATAIVTQLQALISAVKPNAADIPLAPITGMSADDVQEGISELKQSLDGLGSISNVVPYGNTPVVSIDKGGSSKIGKLAFVNIAFTVLSGASVGANTGIITVTGVPTLINNMALNLYDANGNFITGKCRMSGTIIYAGASLTAGNSYNISGFYFTT